MCVCVCIFFGAQKEKNIIFKTKKKYFTIHTHIHKKMNNCDGNKDAKISLTTWNVNYDHRALNETWNAFGWQQRKEAIIKAVLDSDADFACLQELREESIIDIISDARICKKYEFAHSRTNLTDMSFYLLTLWRRGMWLCQSSLTLWYDKDTFSTTWTTSPNGNAFGRTALVSTFCVARNIPHESECSCGWGSSEKPLMIINTHFGLPEAERLCEARVLNAFCREQEKNARCIACGDFNTFMDAGGSVQVETIKGAVHEKDVTTMLSAFTYGEPIPTQSSVSVSGTQIPYPYDTFVKYRGTDHEEKHPREGEMGGHLDHVFYSPKYFKLLDAILVTRLMDGSIADPLTLGVQMADTKPRFPSDHFAISVTFSTL